MRTIEIGTWTPASGATPGMRRPVRMITVPPTCFAQDAIGRANVVLPSGVIVAAFRPSPASHIARRPRCTTALLVRAAVLQRKVEAFDLELQRRAPPGRAHAGPAPGAPARSGPPRARRSSARRSSPGAALRSSSHCLPSPRLCPLAHERLLRALAHEAHGPPWRTDALVWAPVITVGRWTLIHVPSLSSGRRLGQRTSMTLGQALRGRCACGSAMRGCARSSRGCARVR